MTPDGEEAMTSPKIVLHRKNQSAPLSLPVQRESDLLIVQVVRGRPKALRTWMNFGVT
jgi:hypothetical protein